MRIDKGEYWEMIKELSGATLLFVLMYGFVWFFLRGRVRTLRAGGSGGGRIGSSWSSGGGGRSFSGGGGSFGGGGASGGW